MLSFSQRSLTLVVSLMLAVFLPACTPGKGPDPLALSGTIDLSGVSKKISKGSIYQLNGEWELYWNEFIQPEGLISEQSMPVPVPGSWNHLEGHGKSAGGRGYGSYRLRILLDPEILSHRILALQFPDCATTASVFVNGHHLFDMGTPGKTARESVPDERPFLVVIPDSVFQGELDLVVHLSNFDHKKGGIFFPVSLGTLEAVLGSNRETRRKDLILMGILLIMGFYHFFLYLIRRTDTSNLIFSFFVGIMLLRTASTGEKILLEIFPWIGYRAATILDYITFFFAGPLALHFIKKIFPYDLNRSIVIFFYFVAIVASLSLVLPPYYFTHVAPSYLIVTAISLLLAIVILGRAVFLRREYGLLMFFGFVFPIVLAVNDVLNTLEILTTGYLAHYGLAALILSQSMILSARFSRAFDRVQILSEDLARNKDELEIRVKERTRELDREIKERMEAQNRAEELAESKSEFLATMSHEIRTPMNSILGMAELLDETPLNAKQKEIVSVFRRAGATLMNILNDILDLARFESGRFSLDPRPFSLRETLDIIEKYFSQGRKKKEVEFVFKIDPELPEFVLGDPDRVIQILSNLVSNAFKFTERGRVELNIKRDSRDEPWVFFEVCDTGAGIGPEHQKRLFERFFRGDTGHARRSGGTGLGLAICRELVSRMGGEINATSKLGEGSQFFFRIPLPGVSAEGWKDRLRENTKPEALLPMNILVVDDNDDNLFLVERFLEQTPWELSSVKNGRDALSLYATSSFDLVLLDIQMPDMDGFEVLARMRAMDRNLNRRKTPVVALTGQGTGEEIKKLEEAGFDFHLIKPVSKESLIQSISGVPVEKDS